MAEIIPAILEKNFNEIKNKLTFLRGRVKCVQIDLCDGVFVRNQTWPFAFGGFNDLDFQKIMDEEEGLPFWDEFDFELDLMVANAIENFDIYLKLGPKRIIFHPGSHRDLAELEHFLEGIDLYTRDNVEIGIALGPDDDLKAMSKLYRSVDFLQCMGIDKIGFQGEQFDEKVLDNIKFLKENLPGVIISVDGGVNLANAGEILKAGADRLIIGSGIWKNHDPIGALEDLESLV